MVQEYRAFSVDQSPRTDRYLLHLQRHSLFPNLQNQEKYLLFLLYKKADDRMKVLPLCTLPKNLSDQYFPKAAYTSPNYDGYARSPAHNHLYLFAVLPVNKFNSVCHNVSCINLLAVFFIAACLDVAVYGNS